MLRIVVDIDDHATNPDKSDFSRSACGHIEMLDDRVYVTAGSICLGFDRYILDELLRIEKLSKMGA